jgi:hypothetical protein
MKYTIEILAGLIYDSTNYGEREIINTTFDFDDVSVEVRGEVRFTYDYYSGDWWTPSYSKLVNVDSDIQSVIVWTESSHTEFTTEELDKLDELIEE